MPYLHNTQMVQQITITGEIALDGTIVDGLTIMVS